MYVLTDRERSLVAHAIQKTLESIGYIQPERISQNQAYKKYGEGIVKRWVRQGKIKFERRGTSKNSTKSVLIEDLEKIYHSEKNLALAIKQDKYFEEIKIHS